MADIRPSLEDKKCLVLKIDQGALHRLNEELMKTYGASTDFPDYKPHITLTYNWSSDKAPVDLIEPIRIKFDSFVVNPIEP